MPVQGTIRPEENTVEFAVANERGVPMRAEIGDPRDTTRPLPHLSIGWLGGREDELGVVRIGFADLGVLQSQAVVTRAGLTLEGANATAILSQPETSLSRFDLRLTAAQLPRYRVGSEIRLPYDVTGARGLRWSYQAPIVGGTRLADRIEWTDAQGVLNERPLWADGSYAVKSAIYAMDRNDGFGGLRQAGTGKICHVRAPFVTDEDTGDVLWGVIDDAGASPSQLTFVFDGTWFTGRTGPFLFDPDLGQTGVGASSAAAATTLLIGAGHASDTAFQMPENGTTNSVSWYSNSAVNVTYGVYDDSDDSLIVDTAEEATTGEQWKTNNTDSAASVTSGQQIRVSRGGDGSHRFYYDTLTAWGAYNSSYTYSAGSQPDPVSWTDDTYDRDISGYLTYTASGGDPEGPLVGGKLCKGGILMGGRLV